MINIENELISHSINNLLYGEKVSEKTTISKEQIDLINNTIALYFNKQEIDEDTFNTLRENDDFKRAMLFNIQNRMLKIVNDSSTLFFKEIISVVSLLCLGKKFDIFISYNSYDYDEISKLFREYESFLQNSYEKGIDSFMLDFSFYTTLLEAFNELCIINSMDLRKKTTINTIIELISETINMIKFQIPLEMKYIDLLSNLQGKFLLYYSHVPYISTHGLSKTEIINKFKLILEKQIDGFMIATHALSDADKTDYETTLLANSSYLFMLLIKKLESLQEKEPFEISDIGELVTIYQEDCKPPFKKEYVSIDELRFDLLNIFSYIYSPNKEPSYKNTIKNIISTGDLNSNNMEILHNIIFFSNKIEAADLKKLAQLLLEAPKMKNDYYEYYKLKLVDVILNRFCSCEDDFEKEIGLVLDYIQRSNTVSHLISMYSKLHLSISKCYSYKGADYLDKTLSQYFVYLKIDLFEDDKYQSIMDEIFMNIAKTHLNKIDNIDKEKAHHTALKLLNNFIKERELYIDYTLTDKISELAEKTRTKKNISHKMLGSEICRFISQKKFFGLCSINIKELSNKNKEPEDIGFETLSVKISDKYTLEYKYPYAYRSKFENILNDNSQNIDQNIKKLLMLI